MSFLHWRSRTALLGLDIVRPIFLRSYAVFLVTSTLPSEPLEELSPYAAWRAAAAAMKRVPAYREFLARQGFVDNPRLKVPERLRRLPVTDKETYIKPFSTEARCRDGRIPLRFAQVDESSGSSGRPFNWVRSQHELHNMHLEMSQFARYLFGDDLFVINAFSMGAWATGVNVAEALRRVALVKSTGPDLDKILDTLEFFGPSYRYVICGYPPFLKHLIDSAAERGFDIGRFSLSALVGGEALSEEMRAHLGRQFLHVYSAYGASDVDMGIAGELPLSVWIRQQAAADSRLKEALFGSDSRFPMLFQYNPVDYHVEVNEVGELIVTVNREHALSPRIRYNVHDSGGILPYRRAMEILAGFGLRDECERLLAGQPRWQMPFLFLFGRSDSTISYMGANIYPEDIERAVFRSSADHERLGAFCMELVKTGAGGEERPCLHLEVIGEVDREGLIAEMRERVVTHLKEVNRDFRSALGEDTSAGDIQVRLHAPGEGPFAVNSRRIKRIFDVGDASHPKPQTPSAALAAP